MKTVPPVSRLTGESEGRTSGRKTADPAVIERDNARMLSGSVEEIERLLAEMLEKREWGAVRLQLLVNGGEIVKTSETKIKTTRKHRSRK